MTIMHWGPADNYPAPKSGNYQRQYKGSRIPKGKSGGGGGAKPPDKGCGGKKKMFGALFAVIFAVGTGAAQVSTLVGMIT